MSNRKQPQRGVTRREAIRNMLIGTASFIGGSRSGYGQEGRAQGAAIHIERQATGSEIWQVTTEKFSQSNIYCEVPYCSADSKYFVYERVNRTLKDNQVEFTVVELGTWKQHLLDTASGISGCAIRPDGMFFYLKKAGPEVMDLMQADLSKGSPKKVHEFKGGMWTWSLGTVTSDGRYYLRGKRLDNEYKKFGIVLVDLEKGTETIIDQDPYTFNAHPQLEPGTGDRAMIQHNRGGEFDPKGKLIHLVGPEGATLFLLTIPDGKRMELQVGKPYTTSCTGHQAWAGNTREMILTVGASGDYSPEKGNLLGIRDGGQPRVVAKGYKFIHVGVSRCGRLFSCDDCQGAIKIVVGSIQTGKTAVVCESKTSMKGGQNTHAHPYLTPDLKWIIFNSDRSGFPHVHAASVPDGMVEGLLKT